MRNINFIGATLHSLNFCSVVVNVAVVFVDDHHGFWLMSHKFYSHRYYICVSEIC